MRKTKVLKTVSGFSIILIYYIILIFYYSNYFKSSPAWICLVTLKFKVSMLLVEQKYKLNKKKQNRKWKTPRTVLERRTLCFSWYVNRELKIKLWWFGARRRIKRAFLYRLFCLNNCFLKNWRFISVYSVLNKLSEYKYFYMSKNITSYTFLLIFKNVESLHCILN